MNENEENVPIKPTNENFPDEELKLVPIQDPGENARPDISPSPKLSKLDVRKPPVIMMMEESDNLWVEHGEGDGEGAEVGMGEREEFINTTGIRKNISGAEVGLNQKRGRKKKNKKKGTSSGGLTEAELEEYQKFRLRFEGIDLDDTKPNPNICMEIWETIKMKESADIFYQEMKKKSGCFGCC